MARNDVYNITLGGGAPPVKKIPVYQYDIEGNFINSYTSIIEASLIVKTSPNSIRNACNHKRVSADSYWSYDKVDKLDTTEYIKPQRQPVYVYNQDGNFIYKYKSLSECIKNDHIDLYTLKTCLIKQVSYNDKYYSKLKMDVFVKRDVKRHDQWPIYQYDLKGNFIKEYKNIGEAARELKCGSSNISRAIKQGLTAVGYQWS